MASIWDFFKSKQKIYFILSIVLISLAIILPTLYEFSSFGGYRLRKVLLSPNVLKKKYFFEISEETGLRTQYSLSDLVYSIRDEEHRVNMNQYQTFYEQIEKLPSIFRVPKTKIALFTKQKSEFKIFLNEDRLDQKELFQSLEIIEGEDIFRVQLKEPLFFLFSSKRWLYYQKAEIYNIAQQLFLPEG